MSEHAGKALALDDDTARLNAPVGSAALVIVGTSGAEVHALPPSGVVCIGRSKSCDVVVDEATLSRRHAEIALGDEPRIRDLGSANGTRVENRDVPPFRATELAFGQAIELGNVVAVLHRQRPGSHRPARLARRTRAEDTSNTIVVRDPGMSRLFSVVDRVAPSGLSILLQGETGAGKEVLAETIHNRSRRAAGPFVKINCSAIAETLVEAELFGYVRGAFTGAHRDKRGLIEAADGGTLLLDEVGELSAAVQAKLLRVLEAQEVNRVGGLQARPVDVRFVSATNRDLKAAAELGTFRSDLYYRLNGITLRVPPLRERRAEIAPLARRFVEQSAARAGRASATLADEVVARLEGYEWPGNVRELRNAIERATVLAGGATIRVSHLPPEIVARASVASAGARDLRAEVAELERERIVDALSRCSGNQTKAAKLLGMPRRTFVKRLDAYAIARPRKRSRGGQG